MSNNRILFALVLFSILSISCSRQISQLQSFLYGPKLEIKNLEFEYLKAKSKISFQDNNKTVKATANIRIKKDSIIWISLSAIGIEGARAVIKQDSVIFIDRLNKEYRGYDFKDISERFNFDLNYELIQAMILGELTVLLSNEEKVTKTDSYYLVQQRNGGIAIDNYINRTLMKIERVEMIEVETRNTLSFNYGDFQEIDEKSFPFSQIIYLNYNGSNEKVSTKIDIQLNKAETVKKLKFPFNIPQRYERK